MKKSSTTLEESEQNENDSNLSQENKNESCIIAPSQGFSAFQPKQLHKHRSRSPSRKDQALVAFKHSELQKHQSPPSMEQDPIYMNGIIFLRIYIPLAKRAIELIGSCRLVGKQFHAKFFFTEIKMDLPEYLTPRVHLDFETEIYEVKVRYCAPGHIYVGNFFNHYGLLLAYFYLFGDDSEYNFTPRLDFNTLQVKIEDYCMDLDKGLPSFQKLPSDDGISNQLVGFAFLISYLPNELKTLSELGTCKITGRRVQMIFETCNLFIELSFLPSENPSGMEFGYEGGGELRRLKVVMRYLNAIRAFVGVLKDRKNNKIRIVFCAYNLF